MVTAVILLWCVLAGWSSGKKTAQSEAVLANAAALKQSLDYFYLDQDRFPSALEFTDQDRKIMLSYLSYFPIAEFPAKNCPQSYVYKNTGTKSFQLKYCLPKAINGYQSGWNQVTGSR